MIVCIEAVAMPPNNGGCAVQLYAYHREETSDERRDDSVQSANHALQIVDSLCYKEREHAPGEAVILKGEPPRSPEHKQLWIIQLQVRNTHRGVSSYKADYHKFPGCPNDCATYMMEIFGTVKHVLRRARQDLRERKAMKGIGKCHANA